MSIYRIFSEYFDRVFKANRTPDEVLYILDSILKRRLKDYEWDDFISVSIIDDFLESVRDRMEEIWTEKSDYRIEGEMNPNDWNPKGIAEIQKLILKVENYKVHSGNTMKLTKNK